MAGGLKKYVITGHILEVYTYESYFRGKGGANRTTASADLENKLKS